MESDVAELLEEALDSENALKKLEETIAKENDLLFIGKPPYKVVHSKQSGRSLTASREMPAGWVVIQERPMVLGPTASSVPVCLSCHAPVSILCRCSRCQWPVCSEECSDDPLHLSECQVLAQDTRQIGVPQESDPTPRYDLILILRCLLLKERDTKQWEILMSLESHWKQRKAEAEPHHMAAVQYFTKVCPLGIDEDIIHKVRGIIVTNCINSRSASGVSLRGIYPKVSLLNHSCCPNVALRSDQNSQLFVHTAVKVDEDDPLTFCYLSPGEPYWKRHRDLRDVYYFTCTCDRCIDRTEMSMHFSSLKCGKCNKGFIDPMLNKKKTYRCTACRYSMHQVKIMHISISLQSLYSKEQNIVDVHSAMELLKIIHNRGHGKHYTWLACAGVILRALAKTTTIDAHRLRKMLWMRIIDMYSILEPGMTRRRGVSLLQLASVSVLLAIQDYNIGRIRKGALVQELEQCESLLEEARMILLLEPDHSTEQRWLMMADKEKRRLEDVLDRLEDMGEGGKLEEVEQLKEYERIRELEEVVKHESESDKSEESEEESKKGDEE